LYQIQVTQFILALKQNGYSASLVLVETDSIWNGKYSDCFVANNPDFGLEQMKDYSHSFRHKQSVSNKKPYLA